MLKRDIDLKVGEVVSFSPQATVHLWDEKTRQISVCFFVEDELHILPSYPNDMYESLEAPSTFIPKAGDHVVLNSGSPVLQVEHIDDTHQLARVGWTRENGKQETALFSFPELQGRYYKG
ncbi:hypothetical protein NB640_00270 [Oxalobacter vibrioformis]|uniref:Uncharacterized protein n=1 Tax=Oxalobacter vibrioformis TaxID=933080 RepID=A0A9E9LUY4_9BURK|nr:hypothetical protein [Oxalobacter vibrioformis]WAW10145.1 hypothetical protein NB640_00270 [Oxalobacter vibrioformis]